MGLKSDPHSVVTNLTNTGSKISCSSCGSFELRKVEGCDTCANCGYSKCG